MSRSRKCRRVCAEPQNRVLLPESEENGFITLNVDELEALRLCDLEEMDQDTAAERMDVSRGTFQRILYAGRRKTAQALVTGKGILIGGGNYVVAKGQCACEKSCRQCRFVQESNEEHQ